MVVGFGFFHTASGQREDLRDGRKKEKKGSILVFLKKLNKILLKNFKFRLHHSNKLINLEASNLK